MVQPAEAPALPSRPAPKYLSIPPSKERGIPVTDEKSLAFQMSGLASFETHSRNSNSFTPSVIAKADYSEVPGHISGRTTSRSSDVKSTELSNIEYMTPEYGSSPVDELRDAQVQAPLSTQPSAGNFNPWTPFPQNIFSPAEYGSGPNQGVPQLLSHQVSLMQTTPQGHGFNAHQPQGLLPLPDLHGARVQPQFEELSLGGPAFRTGSLSHPHLLQQRDNDVDGSMQPFK